MIFLLGTTTALLSMGNASHAEHKIPVLIAGDQIPFHHQSENGTSSGVAVDYLNLMFQNSEFIPRIRFFPNNRALQMTVANKNDIYLVIGKNDPQADQFILAENPMFIDKICLVVQSDAPSNVEKFSWNKFRTVLKNKRTFIKPKTRDYYKWNLTEIDGDIDSYLRGHEMVAKKRVDAFYSSSCVTSQHIIEEIYKDQNIKTIEIPNTTKSFYFAFRKTYPKNLIARINALHSKLIKSGMNYNTYFSNHVTKLIKQL